MSANITKTKDYGETARPGCRPRFDLPSPPHARLVFPCREPDQLSLENALDWINARKSCSHNSTKAKP